MPMLYQISSRFACATLGVLALGLLAPIVAAQGGGEYVEPKFEKQLFVREAILLETQEVAATVTALAALASNFPGSPEVDHQLRAKALAIALGLDGTDPAALAANANLREAKLPEAISDYNSLDSVAQRLWEIAGFLESPEKGKDERILQFCLVDIAREIDPTNLSESNKYPTQLPKSTFAGWGSILGKGADSGFVFPDNDPDPENDPDPDKPVGDPPPGAGSPDGGNPVAPDDPPEIPANPTRTAEGTYRSVGASGNTPAIVKIRGDLKAGGGTAPLAIVFSDEEGDTSLPLNDYRESLVSALTELHGAWPQDGGVLVLTVDADNADDNALLLSSALLADSLIRERALDPRTVALGFVAPEGSLAPVDRLYQRLRSFTALDIDTILIPEDNLPELQDLALLGELAPFFRFQIILVGDLKSAVAGATAPRDENFEKSLRDFKLVQEVAKGNDLAAMTEFTVVKTTLGKITKLNSKHASASLLLAHGSGKLPKNLTRNGSLAALYRATGPVVAAMQTKGSADRASVLAAFEAVTEIQPILEPGTTALGDMMAGLLKDIGSYASMASKSSAPAAELKTKIFSTWEAVRVEFGRLKNSDG